MSYFDEFDRMQSIFREFEQRQDLYKRLDLVNDSVSRAIEAANKLSGIESGLEDQVRKAVSGVISPISPSYLAIQSLEEQIGKSHKLYADDLSAAGKSINEQLLLLQDKARAAVFEDFQGSKLRFLTEQVSGWAESLARVTHSIVESYDLARKFGVDHLAEESKRFSSWRQILDEAASPVVTMLANELRLSAIKGDLSPALATGFGSQLLSYVAEAEEADSEEEITALLQSFMAWFMEQAKRLQPTKQNLTALVSILAWIFPILYTYYSNTQTENDIGQKVSESEQRIVQRIETSEQTILDHLREIQPQEEKRKAYVIIKASRLRNGPGSSHRSICALPPNLPVEEVDEQGDWVHIEYFDYVKGESTQGWISRKSLKERTD